MQNKVFFFPALAQQIWFKNMEGSLKTKTKTNKPKSN